MAVFSARPYARILLPDLVKTGMRPKQIRDYLRTVGYGYRNTLMYQDIHAFQGAFNKRNMFLDFDTSLIPDKSMMVETPLRRAKSYRVWGEVEYYDTNTKETATRTISMYTDDLESLDELEERYAEEMEAGEFEKSDYIQREYIHKVQFIGVEHNEGWEY